MADETPKGVPTSDILELIARIDDGALYAGLADDLKEVIGTLRKRVAERGGTAKGSLTLKLGFAFDGKLVEVKPNVSVNLPRPEHGKGVFWATSNNELSPQNPAQIDAFAKDVSTQAPRSALALKK